MSPIKSVKAAKVDKATAGKRWRARKSVADRIDAGRAARAAAPRAAHGTWEPAPGRESAIAILQRQATDRVPDLVPIRYGRMVATPFSFYRGAAAVMAADLAPVPRTGLQVQLCGDAHLSNFGAFAAPDRRLVFSINDFDESLPGPFEWDLKRLVASFAIAGRQRGFPIEKRRSMVHAVAESYRVAMGQFADMASLDLWYTRLDVDQIFTQFGGQVHPRERRQFQHIVDKAESKNGLRAMSKLTRVVDGRPEFIHDPPVVVRVEELVGEAEAVRVKATAEELMRSYMTSLADERRVLVERFKFVDIARKVVGVGSVGTRAWVVLMIGRDPADPLVLQFKEAKASVLEPYLGASRYANHGERVVQGQRLMQTSSDILLGWQHAPGFDGVERDFYVRQLWDKKGSVDVDLMVPRGMIVYAKVCGWTLARSHARTGDSVAIAAYLGSSDTFDRAMFEFAETYADQNDLDHGELQRAVADGTVEAILGV